ncbi:uracil-DNA glycosylase family protein [Pseudomonas oryzihabitans]|uniref:Uracil-DNA glycosylase n=1 Tax=Pseudomonas oryzihabitans TaxID=47885 RepID=A0AAJ2EXI2_9PSED|nr:uracil-DNA glycosylase family protein [Pseudomonas psychrotolerans]MDR6234506.1 uracil-DNA glycosylase [Pseudomonas psychrotolerans]MDR6356359.1 uracil-DNA glycosylase [Pseudomonas psychrotolerans]
MPLSSAEREAFRQLAADLPGIDLPVYEQFAKDPLDPIIGLGDPDAPLGFFGRDPGRDEVKYGEPFIGSGGQIARKVLYQHLHGQPPADFEATRSLSQQFFWANTVPYKPLGNKAWSERVKKTFHPLMRHLLVEHWHGTQLITLGREAFLWFGIGQPKEERARLEAFWKREDRFENSIEVTLETEEGNRKTLTLYPLPHPSPLNQTWYTRFPGLLESRVNFLLK